MKKKNAKKSRDTAPLMYEFDQFSKFLTDDFYFLDLCDVLSN